MPQIAIFELMQEISSFNPAETLYDDFVINSGDAWLAGARGGINEIGGALSVFDAEEDVELIPTISAKSITSGGTFSADSWDRLSAELITSLENLRGKGIDGAYFCMHGAMAAGNEMDPEGFFCDSSFQMHTRVCRVGKTLLQGQ